MDTRLRFVIVTLAVITALLVGLVVYVTVVFDPDTFKPDLVKLVKDRKQRHLELKDKIRLTLFPTPAISLGNISLSEHGNNTKTFAAIENVRMSLALLPLLFERRVVLDDVHITGLQATIVRFRDGTTSIDDLLARTDEPAPFKLDIRDTDISDSMLTFYDETTRATYIVSGLALQAANVMGTPGKITSTFSVKASWPEQTDLVLAAGLESGLLLDTDQQHYALQAFKLSLKGELKDIKNLAVNVSGDLSLSVQADTTELTVSTLNAGITGLAGENRLDIRLDVPHVIFAGKHLRSNHAVLTARIDSPQTRIHGDIRLAGISGDGEEIKSDAMTMTLESAKDQRLTRINLTSPLTGMVTTRKISMPELVIRIHHTDPQIPVRTIEGELQGEASLNGATQHAHTSLAGKMAGSAIKATASILGVDNPALRFAIDVDLLDMNQLVPGTIHQKSDGAPANLSGLSIPDSLNATGSIRIGKFISGDIESSNARIEISPH